MQNIQKIKTITSLFLTAAIVAGPFLPAFSQVATAADDPAITECQRYLASAPASELSNAASKSAQCKNLIELFAELAEQQKQLANQKNVSGTLSGDIKTVTSQINTKKAEIKAKLAHIAVLTNSIGEKKVAIQSLAEKIEDQKDSLAQLIRKTNEMDQATLTDFLLSSGTLSEFYSDVSRFEKLKNEVKASVDSIQTIKGVTEQRKVELEKEQDRTIDQKQSLLQTQNSLAQKQAAQKTLLAISKDKETQYAKLIAEQQAKVASIKAKLFQLAGGSEAVRFDVALQYANEAKAATGIDPAFLLAVLTQETGIGKNVGQCYLTDINTGAGVGANTGKVFANVMKPTRDVQPFIAITTSLGYDWQKTRVSCPIAGVAGYGGAMGPAQFIASTWKLFEKRLQSALGHTPNPWAAEDAFMASSMYLTDLGGVGPSAAAQLRAACKYYGSGGATCSYGQSVQRLKLSIQSDIDYLNQYGVSRR
jgi:peptidoglycan hydrolase CwlO-like protein